MFGSVWKKGSGRWRKIHNEEIHNLYSSNIIRVIRSRRERQRCTGRAERIQ